MVQVICRTICMCPSYIVLQKLQIVSCPVEVSLNQCTQSAASMTCVYSLQQFIQSFISTNGQGHGGSLEYVGMLPL